MDMGVDLQILSPGVQNAEEPDLRAEMFGIGCDLEKRRGAGAEQKVIGDFLVVQSQPCEFVRNGKTTCTYLTGSSSLSRSATHRLRGHWSGTSDNVSIGRS